MDIISDIVYGTIIATETILSGITTIIYYYYSYNYQYDCNHCVYYNPIELSQTICSKIPRN